MASFRHFSLLCECAPLRMRRMRPADDCELGVLKRRFGGGSYRAKLFGRWLRGARREAYLEQVSFAIEGPPKPYPPGPSAGFGPRSALGPTGST